MPSLAATHATIFQTALIALLCATVRAQLSPVHAVNSSCNVDVIGRTDVHYAHSVPDLIAAARLGRATVILDRAVSYPFADGQQLAVAGAVSLFCCGSTLAPCASCMLLDIQAGARLALHDCNVDVVAVADAAPAGRPGELLNPTVGLAADNTTVYQLMLGMGVLAGNGSYSFLGGSIVTSCEEYAVFPYFAYDAALLGNDSSVSVTRINGTASTLSAAAPIGYQGGHKELSGTVIACVPAARRWNRALLALLSLLLLVPLCGVLALLWRRRRQRRSDKAKQRQEEAEAADAAKPEALSQRGSGRDGGTLPSEAPAAATAATREGALDDEHLQLHEVIARGGSALVQRGTWRNLPVAVKTIVFQAASPSAGGLARAEAEASIAHSLTHPNIVATYSHELVAIEATPHSATFKLVLVQELCNCGTLRRLLDSGLLSCQGGAPHMARVLSVLAQICAGMRHVHSKRVTHADLNPNNVLLQVATSVGDWPVAAPAEEAAAALDCGLCAVKITDFGLSKRLDARATHASNAHQGTPFYKAPETCEHGRISPASDVYSFGVIMWQLASGESPYLVVNGIAVLHPRFGGFGVAVPKAYAALGAACLAPAPADRPTFAQVDAALAALANELATGEYTDCQGLRAPSLALAWTLCAPPTLRTVEHGDAYAWSESASRESTSGDGAAPLFSSGVNADIRRLQLAEMGM